MNPLPLLKRIFVILTLMPLATIFHLVGCGDGLTNSHRSQRYPETLDFKVQKGDELSATEVSDILAHVAVLTGKDAKIDQQYRLVSLFANKNERGFDIEASLAEYSEPQKLNIRAIDKHCATADESADKSQHSQKRLYNKTLQIYGPRCPLRLNHSFIINAKAVARPDQTGQEEIEQAANIKIRDIAEAKSKELQRMLGVWHYERKIISRCNRRKTSDVDMRLHCRGSLSFEADSTLANSPLQGSYRHLELHSNAGQRTEIIVQLQLLWKGKKVFLSQYLESKATTHTVESFINGQKVELAADDLLPNELLWATSQL